MLFQVAGITFYKKVETEEEQVHEVRKDYSGENDLFNKYAWLFALIALGLLIAYQSFCVHFLGGYALCGN